MLWVYAENDDYFPPSIAKLFYEAFTAAGGKAEFIVAPPFEPEGHHLFPQGDPSLWTPYVDAFLEEQHLKLVP